MLGWFILLAAGYYTARPLPGFQVHVMLEIELYQGEGYNADALGEVGIGKTELRGSWEVELDKVEGNTCQD